MTDSWRTTIAKLNQINEERDLTERELIRLNDALRKAAAEKTRKNRQR